MNFAGKEKLLPSTSAAFSLRRAETAFKRLPVNYFPQMPMPINRKASCSCGGGCPKCQAKSLKLPVSRPNDDSEIEADRVAEQIMSPVENQFSADQLRSESIRKNTVPVISAKSKGSTAEFNKSGSEMFPVRSSGRQMDAETLAFMEHRFGADFAPVKIHTDGEAAKASRRLNAQAFTIGDNVYFGEGQYRPQSFEGRKLLAHELTHTIQQRGTAESFVQRKKYTGTDDAGFYDIDDQACTLNYHQDWYYNFDNSSINLSADQRKFMDAAKQQINNDWSGKYKLITGNKTCTCGNSGFTVDVWLNAYNQRRFGRHGYSVNVGEIKHASTNQPLGVIDMEHDADTPKSVKGGTYPQSANTHEFGHTIGVPDEYLGWSSLFGNLGTGAGGRSVMNKGDTVQPWHYQPFADLLNFKMVKCHYYPEGYWRGGALAEPAFQLGYTFGTGRAGAFNPFAGKKEFLTKPEFIIGLNFDARLSNSAVMGLFYPTIGFDTFYNTKNNTITAGPTTGLRLNRISHPLYIDLSTGLLFTTGETYSEQKLNIPLSVTAGLRGKGFNAGINYMGLFDLLKSGYSHIIGVNIQHDL